MKHFIAIIILTISYLAAANNGRDIRGSEIITISNSKIEAIISKDGIYSRLIDLQEGLEKFDGVKVDHYKTMLDLSSSNQNNIERLLFHDGTQLIIESFRESGGDMGGG